MNRYKVRFAMLLIVASVCSCASRTEDQKQRMKGPDDPHDLVIVLKKENSPYESDFYANQIVGNLGLDGKARHIGVALSTIIHFYKAGFEGYAVDFNIESTQEEKNALRKWLIDSPFVFATFDNAIPKQIVLPMEREAE